VPHRPRGREELPALHMQGRGPFTRWIGRRVHRLVTEGEHIVGKERLPGMGLDLSAGEPRVELIVLTSIVDADHSPHVVVVGEEVDLGRQHDVECGQFV
jgi:hypothetical protein